MANRYEVIDASTGKVILPACGNLAFEAWFDQRGSSDYDFVREERHARQDDDCNWVHVQFVRERTFDVITPAGMLDESEAGEAHFMPACVTGCEPEAGDEQQINAAIDSLQLAQRQPVIVMPAAHAEEGYYHRNPS